MKIHRSRSFSLARVASRSLLVVFVAACDPVAPDAEPPPVRPRDGLLTDATLQGVVDLQVQRDGGALAGMLTHERADVRARAALALGSVQAAETLVPLLAAARGDLDANVRRDAAFAVGQLGQASSVRELASAFEAESDADVRDRILEALGKIASPEAANALLSAEVAAAEQGRRVLALSVNGAVKGVRSQAAQDFLLARLDDADARSEPVRPTISAAWQMLRPGPLVCRGYETRSAPIGEMIRPRCTWSRLWGGCQIRPIRIA